MTDKINNDLDLNKFDIVLPFQLQESAIRGRLVRLDEAMWKIIRQHQYPDIVNDYLAQATALALSILNCFKFDGIFTLQISGDGPLRLLIINANSQGDLRACARFDEEQLAALSPSEQKKLHHMFGQGYMAFTIDPDMAEDRYQGIVELTGTTLAESVNHFFRQSEQLETGFVVASGVTQDSSGQETLGAASLMIQRLPLTPPLGSDEREKEDDAWIHALSLTGSVTKKELLDRSLSNQDLLYRLFWEEGATLYSGKFYQAQCRCSSERIFDMLMTFTPQDREEMLTEDHQISVTCEFCGKSYAFEEKVFEEALAVEEL